MQEHLVPKQTGLGPSLLTESEDRETGKGSISVRPKRKDGGLVSLNHAKTSGLDDNSVGRGQQVPAGG